MHNESLLRSDFAGREQAPAMFEATGFDDPWDIPAIGQERRENWMVSYIDILTLLLTLFAVLLFLQPTGGEDPDSNAQRVQNASTDQRRHLHATWETPARMARQFEPEFDIVDILTPSPHPLDPATTGIDPGSIMPEPDLLSEILDDLLVLPLHPLTTEEAALSVPTDVPGIEVGFDPGLRLDQLDPRLKVSWEAEGVRLEVRDNILFAPSSVRLTAEGHDLLRTLAETFLDHQGLISVEGHTDNRPIANARFPSNWELSAGRASMVARDLIANGIPAVQLQAVGYADTRPVADNGTVAGRQRNRRVSLFLKLPE